MQPIKMEQKLAFLSDLREKLLDLSLKNSLLNFHDKSARIVKIVDELPDHIFKFMVENGNTMTLLPEELAESSLCQTIEAHSDQLDLFSGKNEQPIPNGNSDCFPLQGQYSPDTQLQQAVQSVKTAIAEDQADIDAIEKDGDSEAPEDIGFERCDAPHLCDEFLQTNLIEDRLDGRMRRIYSDYRNIIDSTGSNMLFLSVGFLEWYDPAREPDKVRLAPLILIPVHLKRGLSSVTRNGQTQQSCIYRYSLSYSGDDITTNLTLSLKLRRDFNLELPEIEKDGIESPEVYLENVQKMLQFWTPPTKHSWRVLWFLRLGFFTFSKDVIYRDLDPHNWPQSSLVNVPLVSTVISGIGPEQPLEIPLKEVEEVQKSGKIPTVMDADSSQLKVLIAASKGKNIVVQGPPGTGKSQTIANLIASALAQGKTVLFMAEKLAALEVVQSRLEKVKLAPYCLELHSKSSNVNAVHKQIRIRLESNPKKTASDPIFSRIGETNIVREPLNCHCDLMSMVLPGFDCDIAALFWKFELSKLKFFRALGMELSDPRGICLEIPVLIASSSSADNECLPTRSDLEAALRKFEIIETHISEGIPQKGYAWQGFVPDGLTQEKVEKIGETLEAMIKALEIINNSQKNSAIPYLASCDLVTFETIYNLCGNIQLPPADFYQGIASDIADKNLKLPEVVTFFDDLLFIAKYRGSNVEKIAENANVSESRINLILAELSSVMGRLDKGGECLNGTNKIVSDLKEAKLRISSVRNSVQELANLTKVDFACGYLQDAINISEWLTKITKIEVAVYEAVSKLPPEANTRRYYAIAQERNAELLRKKVVLSQQFDLQNVPSPSQLTNFRAEIREARNTWKEWLPFGRFAAVKKQIRRFVKKSRTKISADLFLASLEELENFPKEELEFSSDANLIRNLGPVFRGCDTNWILLDSALDCFDLVQSFLQDVNTTSIFLKNLPKLLQNTELCVKHLKSIRSSMSGFSDLLPLIDGLPKETLIQQHFTNLLETIENHLSSLKKIISTVQDLKAGPQVPFAELRENVQNAISLRMASARVNSFQSCAKHFFDGINDLLSIKHSVLKETISWIKMLEDQTGMNPVLLFWLLEDETPTRVSLLISEVNAIHGQIFSWSSIASALSRYARIDSQSFFVCEPIQKSAAKMVLGLRAAHNALPILMRWTDFQRSVKSIEELGASHLLSFACQLNHKSSSPILSVLAEAAYYRQWTDCALKKYPLLWEFDRVTHEITRKRFVSVDKELFPAFQQLVVESANRKGQNAPHGVNCGPVSQYSDLGLIRHELEKKRRHIPVRELIRRSHSALQQLMPCWLMGPASVSQFLPPELVEFDLLIMDEASQIRPEDAVGSLARAKQVIVVGDSNQMPPSDVFTTTLSQNDEDTESSSVQDMKSILDHLSQYLQTESLRWHYRSQHHQLIQFSNERYYNKSLIIPPSSFIENQSLGIKWHYLPEALYSNSLNPVEADAVVKHLANHIKINSLLASINQESIGIVVMNVSQRDLVEELWDRCVQNDPNIRTALENYKTDDPIFIKNLENVQGDERDVIVIGFTYGPDVNTKKVYQRFGPINKDDGWRRLNVLFSRSRRRIHVYSSMRSVEVIPGRGDGQRGISDLRAYLEFAETGKMCDLIIEDSRGPDSAFEEAVAMIVTSLGYEVHCQVGVVGFRIDLGVCHPSRPGVYICGIECDGAPYHSHPVARDRDRLREEIMRARGWDIFRIWSTDWYRNRSTEIDRLKMYLANRAKVHSC